MEELGTVIRSITQNRTLFVDSARKTITVKDTEQQIAIADWLLKQLDVPSSTVPAPG